MKIIVNNMDQIISYVTVGNLDGSIEISDAIVPDTFKVEFKPKKFLYVNESVKYNSDYETEITLPPVVNKDLEQRVLDLEKEVQELKDKEITQ